MAKGSKAKTVYICQQCGAHRPRWEGRCSDCSAWNSYVEERIAPSSKAGDRGWTVGSGLIRLNEPLKEIESLRTQTGLSELDRVLGGGLVQGSFVLVGGDPGIGKSTLLLQMSGRLAESELDVLYVSAEESVQQIGLRAQRLGILSEKVQVTSESRLGSIIELARSLKPKLVIVDSIQTVYLDEIQSAPGSVSQVRECAARLMALAKSDGISVFVIGHVTKDGALAGPRVLEHMVDCVLSFEGDGNHQYRLLRSLKNRFGAANELGVFEMSAEGLREVANPSELFLEERGGEHIGSSIFAAIEGSRPLLCEIQALTNSSQLSMPRRTAIGFDINRVHMICAVLDKYLDLDLNRSDVFINVVGGLRLTEPAADLAVAAALISSAHFCEIQKDCIFFGEMGLTGEVRAALFAEERLREARKLGFAQAVLPASNQRHVKSSGKDFRFHWIRDVRALSQALGGARRRPRAGREQPASADVDVASGASANT